MNKIFITLISFLLFVFLLNNILDAQDGQPCSTVGDWQCFGKKYCQCKIDKLWGNCINNHIACQ